MITLLADILLAVGSLIGLATKIYALTQKETVWTRKSSGVNLVTYPVTGLLPMFLLGLWFTFTVSVLNFLTWLGIYIFRAPEDEDWFGREI
jgi:ABC-type xylose transport system permease subunit